MEQGTRATEVYYAGPMPDAEVVGPWRRYPRTDRGRPRKSVWDVRRKRVTTLLTEMEYAAMERWGKGAGHGGPCESARVAIGMAVNGVERRNDTEPT